MNRKVIRSAYLMITVVVVLAAFLVGPPSPSAKTDSGVPASVWSLKGNRGTEPGGEFLGTTDNRPLIVKTDSTLVLTLGSDGPVEVHKALVVHANETVDHNLLVHGDGTVDMNLLVHGTGTVDQNLTVKGALSAAGGLSLSGPLALTGDATIGGNVAVSGQVQTASLVVSGTSTTSTLNVSGTTTTGVLTITGGSDLAEPFALASGSHFSAGSVLVIDDQHPGELTLSDRPYDRRVAGIVSGAEGIVPGIRLAPPGAHFDNASVALAGRAYALADVSNGAILPGDLLTTSMHPGRVMRATDPSRWVGAVVGKAMSGLDKGKGFVLVLVNLQ